MGEILTTERWEAYTGLVYLRARYYGPGTGRFLTKDFWGGDYQSPTTLNVYLYAAANPMTWVDPTGLYPAEPEFGWSDCEQDEDCTVHPVVKFILDKIRMDSAGEAIKEIRDLNESHVFEDAWIECQRMPWWQQLLVCPSYLQQASNADMAAHVAALEQFGCMVADSSLRPICGQWDYKADISPRWGEAQKIDFCSIGHDEKIIFYYDIWANIHFGFLGMTGGFSEDELLSGATLEQAIRYPGQFEDDPSDQACVGIGIHLYQHELTEAALLEQIYLHQSQLNKAQVEDGKIIRVYR